MEAVGAVASIVGIAGFAGQAISGLSKLSSFFEDCRTISKTADRFLRDISALEKALRDVEAFLTRAKTVPGAFHATDLASLNINVEDCSKDVQTWVQKAQGLVSDFKDSKSWFKKFLVVVKKQSIRDIFDEIGSHKSSIMLSLSAAGRLLDVYNCSQADMLVSKVGEATSYGKMTVEALSRLETMMETPNTYEVDSLRTSVSLSSIASAVSRIESLVSHQLGLSSSPIHLSRIESPSFQTTAYSDFSYSKFAVPEPNAKSDVPTERNLETIGDIIADAADPAERTKLMRERRRQENERAAAMITRRRNAQIEEKRIKIEKSFLEREQLLRARDSLASKSIDRTPTLKRVLEDLGTLSQVWPQDVPSGLVVYMQQYVLVYSQTAHVRMLLTLLDHVDSPNLQLEAMCVNLKDQLEADKNSLMEYRRELWDAGRDLEGIDQLMHQSGNNWERISGLASFDRYPSSEVQETPWWTVLHHPISQSWVTKNDRINSWLLQNLATLPEEANRHREMLKSGDQLSEEQWARMVLKFWPLDEAAARFEHSTCSTNGAIDSAGACHSVKVLLSALPFNGNEDQVMLDAVPIRGRGRADSEDGSRVLERARAGKRKRLESEVGDLKHQRTSDGVE